MGLIQLSQRKQRETVSCIHKFAELFSRPEKASLSHLIFVTSFSKCFLYVAFCLLLSPRCLLIGHILRWITFKRSRQHFASRFSVQDVYRVELCEHTVQRHSMSLYACHVPNAFDWPFLESIQENSPCPLKSISWIATRPLLIYHSESKFLILPVLVSGHCLRKVWTDRLELLKEGPIGTQFEVFRDLDPKTRFQTGSDSKFKKATVVFLENAKTLTTKLPKRESIICSTRSRFKEKWVYEKFHLKNSLFNEKLVQREICSTRSMFHKKFHFWPVERWPRKCLIAWIEWIASTATESIKSVWLRVSLFK